MIIIHDLSGEKPRTRLGNAHIVEKCENKIQEIGGGINYYDRRSKKIY